MFDWRSNKVAIILQVCSKAEHSTHHFQCCCAVHVPLPIGHISGDVCDKTAFKLTEASQPLELAWWPETKLRVPLNA